MPTLRCLVPALLAVGPLMAMDWPGVDLHGFVSQGYLRTTGNTFVDESETGTFAYSEIGLNIASQVTDRLRVGAQLFAYDLGGYGNMEIIVDWAYGDYRHNDLLGIRLGRFKLPAGLYGEMLDLDLAFTAVLLPQAVYDARYRELFGGLNGAQIYGLLPVGPAGSLEYQTYIGTTNISNDGYLADQFTVGSDALDQIDTMEVGTTLGCSLNYRPPVPGLRVNASLLYSNHLDVTGSVAAPPFNLPATSKVDSFFIASGGIEYSADRLTLAGEYRVLRGDVDVTVDATAVGGGLIEATTAVRSDGAYVMGAYRLSDAFEVGSYYGIYWSDRNDRDGDRFAALPDGDRFRAWQRDLALTLRWDVNPSWIVKIEGHYLDGTAMLSSDMNPDGWERYWFLFAAKTTLSF